MISTADFRAGLTIEHNGNLYQVLEYQHVMRGRGSAFVRAKLRNLRTSTVVEQTFSAGEKMEQAFVERRPSQFLYRQGDEYIFMDTETYEQTTLSADWLRDAHGYLKEGQDLTLLSYRDESLGVELPTTVELKVAQTDPGLRGDTATGGTKVATLETGASVRVPLFITEGETIRVNTHTGEYIERV